MSTCKEVIKVDPDRLEYNQPPFVARRTWGLTSAEDPNKTFEGFTIEMDVDIRDVLGTPETDDFPAVPAFPFSHKVYRTTQSIVTVPMLSYGLRNDNEIRKQKLAAKPENQPIADGLDNSLRDFVERHGGEESFDYQLEQKQFIVDWPDNVNLDGTCLACNEGEKKLELKLQGHIYTVNVESLNVRRNVVTVKQGGMDVELNVWKTPVEAKLIWCVADKNSRDKKTGRPNFKRADTSTKAAAAMLADMGIDG